MGFKNPPGREPLMFVMAMDELGRGGFGCVPVRDCFILTPNPKV